MVAAADAGDVVGMKPGASAVRVLVVDDNVDVRAAICAHLRMLPSVVVVGEAADGDQALFAADGLRPDVVLMDVSMPGCNGIEATRRLRARLAGVVVILISVNSSALIQRLAIEAGADAFISKDELAGRISGILQSVFDRKMSRFQGGAI